LAIAPLCRGILWGRLTIPGRSGHIELPQGDWRQGGAVDAIALARLFLDHIDRLNTDWALRKRHPYLPTPCQVYVAQIQGGEYPTAFANRVDITFNAQYLPAEKDDNGLGSHIKRELEIFFATVAATEPWLRKHPPTIEWLIDADCGETPADHPFVQVCANALESLGHSRHIEGVSAHTDMGWFVNVGIPTINFGGGEARLAHQSDESIAEQDLLETTKAIALTILEWCGVIAKE
ncbi:MAG: M20/M25/M40 family metallo-hydrolase, partial [Caldilineaceae bacterium]|nr:M20/M25/M40 family metallo-hydrolase [Caldilineaceae bacterium]